MKNQNVTLNRALFQSKTFDSASLGVLAAIHHRFATPGDYDVLVSSVGKVTHRTHVHVAKEDAPGQVALDLAALGRGEAGCSCGDAQQGTRVLAGGTVCFYAGMGTRAFTIAVNGRDEKGAHAVLDTGKELAAGDVFSTTLVRPGLYRVGLRHAKSTLDLLVEMPDPKKKAEPQQDAQVVRVGKEGFDTNKASMQVGQTIFFVLEHPCSVRAELVKPEHDDDELWGKKEKK